MSHSPSRTNRRLPRPGLALPALLLAAAPLLVACAVGPNNEAPEIAAPSQHRGDKAKQPSQKSFAELPWWEVYRDPNLFHLLKEGTDRSYDLRIAMSRVEIARQSYRAASWALAPTLGVSAGAGDVLGTNTFPQMYPPTSPTGLYGVTAGASWEPDIWGRLRRLSDEALYQFEAEDENRRGVYITLVGDIAELYFNLETLDLQRIYAQQAVATRQETVALFEARAAGGVGNELEVARARASLAQAETSAYTINLSIQQTENTLSYLVARPPGAIERNQSLDAIQLPPEIPAGIPSTLLKRRPDIRAAEKQLLAANARIGVEEADYFPRFELTGFVGVASPNLKEAGGIGGGVGLFNWTLPFLGGERVRAEVAAAEAAWKGATANYERTAMNAFREVADGLAAVENLRVRRESTQKRLAASEAAEKLAMERYRGGVANYLDVLTAQEQLLAAQLEMSDIKGKQHVAVSRLYRVLGGGWPVPEEGNEETQEPAK